MGNKKTMKVSVCMATYNGSKYLKTQLESILIQLNPDDELIISDDGSTDETISIIQSVNDDRVCLYHSKAQNIIKNFENALNKATGDVIFLADQDDIWHKDKVIISKKHLLKYDCVFTNLEVFEYDDLDNTYLFFNDSKSKTGFFRNLIKNNYVGATMAFRKELLIKALPLPKDVYMHDVWIAMIAELTSSTYFISKALIYYRRHGKNASATGERSKNSFFTKLRMRYKLVYYLVFHLIKN